MHSYSPNHVPRHIGHAVASASSLLKMIFSPSSYAMTAAAYTPEESDILDALTQLGFEERDITGLLHHEAEAELGKPVDQRCFDALRKKIWRGTARKRTALANLLPSASRVDAPAPLTVSSCPPACMRPLAPPRQTVAKIVYQHSSVGVALVEAVLHPAFSSLASEHLVAPGPQRAQYVAALAEALLSRFQPGTLAAVLRSWHRFLQWHMDRHSCTSFVDVTVANFLHAQQPRGATVPAAHFQHFKWLRAELRVPFPLESPLLKQFASSPVSTWPRQVPPLQPQLWKHLLDMCSTGSPLESVPLAAAFVLRFAVSGLRFRHCKRATLAPELGNARTLVWRVSAGKDGQPFTVSLPTCVASANNVFMQLHQAAQTALGPSGPFLPNMFFQPSGSVVIRSACASFSRFQTFFRSLLTLPPLSLSKEAAGQFSTRSCRRFLPTVADALQLPEPDRLCLGNWSDGRRLPLPVRYSAERLETAAQVRRLCLASVNHLLRHVPECQEWSKLRAVVPHLARLRDITMTSAWGEGLDSLPEPSLEIVGN